MLVDKVYADFGVAPEKTSLKAEVVADRIWIQVREGDRIDLYLTPNQAAELAERILNACADWEAVKREEASEFARLDSVSER
jgi:hypothetical protein